MRSQKDRLIAITTPGAFITVEIVYTRGQIASVPSTHFHTSGFREGFISEGVQFILFLMFT